MRSSSHSSRSVGEFGGESETFKSDVSRQKSSLHSLFLRFIKVSRPLEELVFFMVQNFQNWLTSKKIDIFDGFGKIHALFQAEAQAQREDLGLVRGQGMGREMDNH